MINAGKYNKKIKIYTTKLQTDSAGFQSEVRFVVLEPYANVKTTKGMTIIKNNSDFEKALTNFTIRYPITPITRDMLIEFKGKTYEIQYLNDIDLDGHELEIQAKEVTH